MVGYPLIMFNAQVLPCEKCNLCQSIPRKPVNDKCGHLLCEDCWFQYCQTQRTRGIVEDNDDVPIPCPVCSVPCAQQLKPNAYIQRLVWSAPVKCPHYERGCRTELNAIGVEEINYLQHLEECAYELVMCPLMCINESEWNDEHRDDQNNLNQKLPPSGSAVITLMERRLVAAHVRAECGERLITCKVCKVDVKAKDIPSHQNNDLECVNSQICAHGCEQIIRTNPKQVEEHDQICPLKEIHCEICQEIVQRKELESHNKEKALHHVDILSLRLKESEKRYSDLFQKDANLKKRLDKTEATNDQIGNTVALMMKRMEAFDTTNKEVLRMLQLNKDIESATHSRSVSKSKSSKGCLMF